MNATEARVLLFKRKLKYEDYELSIPGVPELDGQLGLLELTAAATMQVDKLSKNEDGESEESLQLAGMVAQSLVMRETKERIFSDNDIEAVSGFGLSVLVPLSQRIKAMSGLDEDALELAKKNLKKTKG